MQLVAAPDDPCVRRAARVGCLSLLQVIDVLDLRVGPESVVVAAEVRLTVGEEDRLVALVSQSGHGEVPPLCEESRRDKHNERNGDAAEEPPLLDDPADRAPVCELQAAQRVGLGVALGRTVGDGVVGGVVGGAVAVGS